MQNHFPNCRAQNDFSDIVKIFHQSSYTLPQSTKNLNMTSKVGMNFKISNPINTDKY